MRVVALVIIAVLLLGLVSVWINSPIHAQSDNTIDVTDYRSTMIAMLAELRNAQLNRGGDVAVFQAVAESGDSLYIAPLLDLAFFSRGSGTALDAAVFLALAQLTGLSPNSEWQAFFTWASENDIALPPSYDEFKGLFLAVFVDPNFERFFRPGIQENARINLVEVVWGGVRVDGIPSLVNAKQITPEAALAEGESLTRFCRDGDCAYPASDELVFGVSINGDNRAYPLRILNWHEMFNDVIGHVPLYDMPDGEVVCNFRAPTPFQAIARQGEVWVQVSGYSAGCPQEGWLQTDGVEWLADDWRRLPENGVVAVEEGVTGRVKGKPVMLAYCALCGSGILYDVTIPDLVVNGEARGQTVLEFSSTGLLMRSNKLMYDRATYTVWNAITGEPAFGPLAESDIRLPILPVVVTDWATWLAEHPDTSVLSLETGYQRNYTNGGAYEDYFNNPNFIMFPVWQQDTSENLNKDMVFALRINEVPKAYPVRVLVETPIINDTLGGENVVIVSRATPNRTFFEPGGAAVRAYARGDYMFSATENADEIMDDNGVLWRVTEDGLVNPDGDVLPRLGGHLAFWFGWYAFYPETLVYEALVN